MPRRRWSGGRKNALRGVADHPVADADAPGASFCSSPATMRSVVVLPQPDGPSSVTNSPVSTSRSDVVDGQHSSPNLRLTSSSDDGRHP